jgi:membrane-associated phospholipid phosphatase
VSMTEDVNAGIIAQARSWFARFAANLKAGFVLLLPRPPRPMPAAYTQQLTPGRLAIGALIVLAAVIWEGFLFDVPAIVAARQLPRWLVATFRWLTDFGKSGWFLVPLAVALVTLAAIAAMRSTTAFSQRVLAMIAVRLEFLFFAIALPGLFATIVKRLIGRARPFVGGSPDAFLYHPFVWRVEYASMPSGHATTAFAVVVAFGAIWPRWRPLLWFYALVICVSRVVVTAHHPSDVIVGAVVGALGAVLVRNIFAARRRIFAYDAGGEVAPMSGPSLRRMKSVARRAFAQ